MNHNIPPNNTKIALFFCMYSCTVIYTEKSAKTKGQNSELEQLWKGICDVPDFL